MTFWFPVGLGALVGALCMFALAHLFLIPAAETAARKGYVLEVRAISAEAERDELLRQVRAGAIVVEAYQTQLKNLRAQDDEKDAEIEKSISSRAPKCVLDNSDIEFLRQ